MSERNQRWRKYAGKHVRNEPDLYGPHFAAYLWRRWNRRHEGSERLARLSIYYMHERNLLGHEATPVEKRLVAETDSPQAAPSPHVASH